MKKLKKLIFLSIIVISTFLLNNTFVFAVTQSCTPPYTSIEQAVICSGGTYGVIDTSDPDSSNNFVDTVFDNGLTAVDGGSGCTSMSIKTGINISCMLGVNNDAYYYYEGKKGEKVTVTVVSNNLDETFDVSFDNKSVGRYTDNKPIVNKGKNTKTYIINSELQYDGNYTIRVAIQGYENNQGEPFTINVVSDKSGIKPDIRKDNLIEGKEYSVYELNQNQSTTSRRFLVDAYVLKTYVDPPCPPEAYSCPISIGPSVTIGDICTTIDLLGACTGKKSDATIRLDYTKKYNFEIGKQYQFEVSVQNTSKTNVPQNNFNLVSFNKSSDDTVVNHYSDIGTPTCSVEGKISQILKPNSIFSIIVKSVKNLETISGKGAIGCPVKVGEEYKASVSDYADIFYLSLQQSIAKDKKIKTGIYAVGGMTASGTVGPADWLWNTNATFDLAPTPVNIKIEKTLYSSSNLPINKTPMSSLLGNKDLKLGSNAPEVKILQQILNNNGFIITTSGAGSLGNETTYFGNLTKQALIRFQQKYNITPAVGYFGTITREKMKSLGL